MQDKNITIIQQEKESSMNFRKRRHEDWNDNYTLYRDKVITNRLTQRQTVNIPLMKYGIQTIMKDIDETPIIWFESRDNDKQQEIFYNEFWNEAMERNKLQVKDRVDKKQALLYGRTFKKLNIVDGKFVFEIIDPQDMLIERHIDPAHFDTVRSVIQIGIYRTLNDILKNPDYNESAKQELRTLHSGQPSEQRDDNYNNFVDKNVRMANLGLIDAYDPVVGETYIELNEVYRKEWDEKLEQNIIQMYVVATSNTGMVELMKKPLHEIIGETADNYWYDHFPYTSWGADPERTDFWSDGAADVIRQPNKLLNAWISQLSENRTLRNLNMHYYDASNAQFVPQTFQPVAWGWYPVPGNPNELVRDVQVPDLSESLDEMQFVINIAEKAIATSGTTGGAVEQRQVTLGEVQLAVANAQARTKSMSIYYNEDWKEFAIKYSKMIEAAVDKLDPVVVYKKGRAGKKLYRKEIKPSQLMSKSGWDVTISIKSDKMSQEIEVINKLNAVKNVMPDNKPLDDIYKSRLLEFLGLTSEEMREVLEFQKTMETAPAQLPEVPEAMGMATPQAPGMPTPTPMPTNLGAAPVGGMQ